MDRRTDIVKVEQYSALAEFPKKELFEGWISQNFSLFFGVHWELVWFLDWKEYDVGDDNSPFIIHVIKNGFVVCTQWMIHAIKFVNLASEVRLGHWEVVRGGRWFPLNNVAASYQAHLGHIGDLVDQRGCAFGGLWDVLLTKMGSSWL